MRWLVPRDASDASPSWLSFSDRHRHISPCDLPFWDDFFSYLRAIKGHEAATAEIMPQPAQGRAYRGLITLRSCRFGGSMIADPLCYIDLAGREDRSPGGIFPVWKTCAPAG